MVSLMAAVHIIIIGAGQDMQTQILSKVCHPNIAFVSLQGLKQFEKPIEAEALQAGIEKSIMELKMLELDCSFIEEDKERCREGWYNPRALGKTLAVVQVPLYRARSKTIIQCRYKWKLKKSKKAK